MSCNLQLSKSFSSWLVCQISQLGSNMTTMKTMKTLTKKPPPKKDFPTSTSSCIVWPHPPHPAASEGLAAWSGSHHRRKELRTWRSPSPGRESAPWQGKGVKPCNFKRVCLQHQNTPRKNSSENTRPPKALIKKKWATGTERREICAPPSAQRSARTPPSRAWSCAASRGAWRRWQSGGGLHGCLCGSLETMIVDNELGIKIYSKSIIEYIIGINLQSSVIHANWESVSKCIKFRFSRVASVCFCQ